jgi:SAM-dependent methyltransferase
MTGASSPSESSRFPVLDFDALHRGESPAEGFPAVATPPWDTKAPKENVIAWREGGWVHDDVLDIDCGLGDNAIYLAKSERNVTGSDISPTALITAERRATDAGVNVRFVVTDSPKLEGYTDAFDTIVDSGMPAGQRHREAGQNSVIILSLHRGGIETALLRRLPPRLDEL